MASGSEIAAEAARKAKGIPEPDPKQFWRSLIVRVILKEINMGSLGKLAAWFSGSHTKMVAAIIGSGVGLTVSLLLGWLAVKIPTIATCTLVVAEKTCTLSLFGSSYSQAEITAALMGIVMTWLAAHVTAAAPANKP